MRVLGGYCGLGGYNMQEICMVYVKRKKRFRNYLFLGIEISVCVGVWVCEWVCEWVCGWLGGCVCVGGKDWSK